MQELSEFESIESKSVAPAITTTASSNSSNEIHALAELEKELGLLDFPGTTTSTGSATTAATISSTSTASKSAADVPAVDLALDENLDDFEDYLKSLES